MPSIIPFQSPIGTHGTASGEIRISGPTPVNPILTLLLQRTESTSPYRLHDQVVAGVGVGVGDVGALLKAYQAITDEINELKTEIAQLKNAIEPEPPQIREISDAKAKSEVRAFFKEHDGEVIYPDDVAEALNIDLMQAVRVCEALTKEGKIAPENRGSS